MIAAVLWLRIWVFSMEVPGLNAGHNFFSTFLMQPFYPAVTILLEYFNPVIYSCLVFAL